MKLFHSKILLFGEYTLLKESMGLAIPYSNYSGNLVQPDENSLLTHKQLESNSVIKKLAIKMAKLEPFSEKEQIDRLLEDALLGLYFDSNIPNSYGIGSSGSLVAAIYDKYFCSSEKSQEANPRYLKNLQFVLSQIETYFHGKSSGIDPLVSYLNLPVLLNAPQNNFELPSSPYFNVFLIDTGKPSSTREFMQLFEDMLKDESNLVNILIRKNNVCISAFLEGRMGSFDIIKDFCDFENQFLSKMFYWTEPITKIYEKHHKNLAVKLCGSGGGGFLLGFAKIEAFNTIKKDFLNDNIRVEEININNCKLIKI